MARAHRCDRISRLLFALLPTLFAGGAMGWAVPPTGSPPLPKLHPTLLKRLSAAPASGRVTAWVLFQDKGFVSQKARQAAVLDLARTYNPKAVQRRRLRRTEPGLFDEHDLPVARRYVDSVVATGITLRRVSRWINGVSVLGTREQLQRIAALPFVRALQPVRRGRGILPTLVEPSHNRLGATSPGPTGTLPHNHAVPPEPAATALAYGLSQAQLTQINLIALHQQGFTAAGVIVGILDTGFQRTHLAFHEPGHGVTVVAERDFINNDGDTSSQPGDPPNQHAHGTYILGTLGAYRPGELIGAAFDASFILCKTEDTTAEYPAEEDNYVAGLEFIEANGGDVATSSLGYIDWYTQADLDGLTAVTTVAVNIATANGLYCCTAAGNSGHAGAPSVSTLIAPADALKVITVGAVDNTGFIASFSSNGPTADGRLKPEVLALGVGTQTVSGFSDTTYAGVSGTSLSTPLVAGAVACLVQAHPNWTVDQLRNQLFKTASDFVANGTVVGNFIRGYGVIDALAASAFQDCNHNGIDDQIDLANGTSLDLNGNGIPDECDARVPTLSQWGLGVMAMLLLGAGVLLVTRRERCARD